MRCAQWRVLVYCQDQRLKDWLLNLLTKYDDIVVLTSNSPTPPSPTPFRQLCSSETAEAEIIEEGYLTLTEVSRLQLLVDYGTVKQAAQKAGISENTFNNQLRAIRAKLAVNSTLEAVLWALKRGIVQLNKT